MSNLITLSEIAKSVKVTGKVARRRLRASEAFKKSKEGWVFSKAQRAKVLAVITGKA